MSTGARTDPPIKQDFGSEFNYWNWTAETQITLCRVPWSSDYLDVVSFPSTAKLNEYLDRDETDNVRISNASYARADQPITLDVNYNIAQGYNYVRVFNPANRALPGDVAEYFYYFILDAEYVAGNATRFILQLDVWQTFSRQVQLGRCYVERGHIGIANQDNFRNYGRDFLTVPEGVDTGSDYAVIASKSEQIMRLGVDDGYHVLVVTSVDLNGPAGDKSAPDKDSAKGGYIQNVPVPVGVYLWRNISAFLNFLSTYSTKPWITNGIQSVTLIPPVGRYMFAGQSYPAIDAKTGAMKGIPTVNRIRRDIFKDWRTSSEILNYIPERYRHLKKFFTSPYCVLEMTNHAGSAVILNPEAWNSKDASILESMSYVPGSQRASFIPLGYNSRNPVPAGTSWDKSGDYADRALFLTGFPQLPIMNDSGIMAYAQNSRSISQSRNAASWAQQRALTGNQVSYDQATRALDAGIESTNSALGTDARQVGIGNRLAQDTALTGAMGGMIGGAGLGAIGGPAGAAVGASGAGLSGIMNALSTNRQISANNESYANRAAGSLSQLDIQQRSGAYMRDSNKALADFATRGDYAQAVAGINAKVQDMEMLPNTIQGQFGGETLNLITGDMELALRVKMIDQASIAIIGEYWLRYGYAVHRPTMIPNDYMVMERFTYWKMTEARIRSARIPERMRMAIKGIFEKGVTVYRDPSDIGTIDPADNKPINGIRLDSYTPPVWVPDNPIEDVPETKRKKKTMLLYSTEDENGTLYAVGGASPGTDSNWMEFRSAVRAGQYADALIQPAPVPLVYPTEWNEVKAGFTSPLATYEVANPEAGA